MVWTNFRESLRLQQVYNTITRYGFDMLLDRGTVGDFRRTDAGNDLPARYSG